MTDCRTYEGKIEVFDDYGYDGEDEYWAGASYELVLDHPEGKHVSFDLGDLLRALDGKRVRLTIEVVDELSQSPVSSLANGKEYAKPHG